MVWKTFTFTACSATCHNSLIKALRIAVRLHIYMVSGYIHLDIHPYMLFIHPYMLSIHLYMLFIWMSSIYSTYIRMRLGFLHIPHLGRRLRRHGAQILQEALERRGSGASNPSESIRNPKAFESKTTGKHH